MPEVTVVVPARDAAGTIGRTLAALAAQELNRPYEVIVVDSGSSDDTVAIARASPVVTAVLHNPGGEPAGSRNLGVAHADGRLLAFTDADCEPEPEWLAAGLQALAEADIVQGRVRPTEDPGPLDRTLWVGTEYGLYETANLFVRRETFERIGGFEPVLALDSGELVAGARAGLGTGRDTRPFGEDTWFVWRARRAGAVTAFAADALVLHAVFPQRPHEFVAERTRCRYFPPLVALIPELRTAFLHRRYFLSPDSLRFDVAVAGSAAALLLRHPLPLLALAPYARAMRARLISWPPSVRTLLLAGTLAADATTCAALVRGSLAARTAVL